MANYLANVDRESLLRFKPRARLLLQLGDQLIKNESIALVELVKNSYDADANKVTIYMEGIDNPEEGVIIIEDDGFGMSAEIVENVWLEPGSDFKEQQILKNKTSPKFNRLPIGEKGIGRFGVHKLGNIIEMTTKAKDSNEVFVRIDWEDFKEYKYLDQVPIKIIERKTPIFFKDGNTGTNIIISKLRKKWERGIAREIKRSITALSSPFQKNDSFSADLAILDKPGWLEGIVDWNDIKEYSLFAFKIEMQGSSITAFNYSFTPWQTMTRVWPRKINIEDELIQTFKTLRFKNDLNETEVIHLENYNIGKITFEGYIFDLDSFILKMGVTDKTGFKKYLKSNGGVRVFRDGLRVYDYGEPENDWLNLDFRRFQQPTKAISNNLILGAVLLNRNESTDLVEKTNREGFVEDDAYKAFRNAILHSLDLVETLRLEDKRKLKEFYGPTPKSSPLPSTISSAIKYVEEHVSDSTTKKEIIKYFNKIEADYKNISENLLKAAGAGLSMSVVVHEVEKILYEVLQVLKVEKASERVLKLITHLSSLIDGYAEIIRKSSRSSENIIQILDQALFNTEYRLQAHRIEVLADYENFDGTKKIKIAKNLLIGTLMNLIDNSIYWLDQKEFSLKEKNERFDKRIWIDIVEEENTIAILVADNGTGFLIPTDDVTEPFVSAKPGGMGLGLHIANEIMEAQGGRLIFPEIGDFVIPEEFKKGAQVVLSFKK